MTNFELILDNAGGIQLQADSGFIGHFDIDRMAELAESVSEIMSGAEPGVDDWGSMGEECRIEYDNEAESAGQYRWISGSVVFATVGDIEELEDFLSNVSSDSLRDFYEKLFAIRNKAFLQQ